MDEDSDFTFSQARPLVSGDGFVAPDISGMNIKDDLPNGSGSKQNGGFLWRGPLPKNAGPRKQETVGSLSFNVIDTSPSAPDCSKELAIPSSGSVGAPSVAKVPREPKMPARRPVPRAKVPFEKGYSQMDWLKLTRTHPDLAGLKGQSNRRLVSMNEVKQHQTEEAMWTVLKGRVYNLSPYMKFHPGGVDMLMKAVGKDCTALFIKYHAWVNAEFLLEKCLVGILDDSHKQPSSKLPIK